MSGPRRNPDPELTSEQIRLILDGLGDHALCSMDAEGILQTWSRGARRISGYRAEEVLGKPFAGIFPPEEVARGTPAELLRRAREGRIDVEGWRARKDGARYWAHSEISPVVDAAGALAGYVDITCDITERKADGDVLARGEEAFRTLVQSVRDYAIFMLDRRGNVTSWNAGAERIKGWTEEEILGEPYARFFTPEAVEAGEPFRNLQEAAARGHVESEGWRVRKDGTRFWADVTLTALRDERGRLRGFAKVTRDATARKRSEDLLRESEERCRQLVDGVEDHAIFMVGPDGRVASWSAGSERVQGYHADEVIGRHVSMFYAPEDLAARRPEVELGEAAERGRWSGQGPRVRRDGTVFQAVATLTAVRDPAGGLKGFASVVQDVSVRRRSEEDLRRAEEKFRLLVEGVREVAIFLLDPDGRVASWNPGAERLKGWRAEEIVGKSNATFYTPEDREAGRPRRLLQLAASEGQARDEGWRVRKDGTRFWADVLITALYDAGGLLRGFSKVTRDLSERRRREEEVRRLNAELQAKVADLESFASTFAHDVGSPLRAVTGFAELLLADWGDRLPEEGREQLRSVVGGAQRMRRLLDDLLAYSRLGHAEVASEAIDVLRLAEDVLLEMAHPLAESKARVKLAKPFAKVLGNEGLLRQALSNLVANAVKFSRPGTAPSVSIATERREGRVRIVVEDEGIGIAESETSRLFQPFQRLGDPRRYPGTGLGLAIVRRAAERMDGRAGRDPAPGGGSRFWIELPEAG